MDDDFKLLSTSRTEQCSDRVSIGLAGDRIYRCENRQPLIVFGPQRSGKTTSVVIPAVLEWEGPCLVTSVRYDVAAVTLRRRQQLGETFIFDPAGVIESAGSQFVDQCVGWSPLDSIETWDDAVKQAGSLTEGADLSSISNGNYWLSAARLLLTPLLFAAARTGGTMGDVLGWLGMDVGDLIDELLARPRTGADPVEDSSTDWSRCIRKLINYESYHPDTYSSICSTAGTLLEVFDYTEVERRCSQENRLPLDTFLNGGSHTLYMCGPPSDQRRFKPLFTALVRQVVAAAINRNSETDNQGNPIVKVPLMLCLDEAGNIAKLDDLDTLATTAAGSGIQLISVFHDMSQLYAAYEKVRGDLIINNHRGKVFLPGNSDPTTGKFLHEQLLSTDIRRQRTHRGWRTADLRELKSETALCLYGGLQPTLLSLRRWNDDERLRMLADNTDSSGVRP